jgi:hypothetical protein
MSTGTQYLREIRATTYFRQYGREIPELLDKV